MPGPAPKDPARRQRRGRAGMVQPVRRVRPIRPVGRPVLPSPRPPAEVEPAETKSVNHAAVLPPESTISVMACSPARRVPVHATRFASYSTGPPGL